MGPMVRTFLFVHYGICWSPPNPITQRQGQHTHDVLETDWWNQGNRTKWLFAFFFKLTFLYYEAEGIMFFTSKDPNGRKNIEKKPKYRLIAKGKKKWRERLPYFNRVCWIMCSELNLFKADNKTSYISFSKVRTSGLTVCDSTLLFTFP